METCPKKVNMLLWSPSGHTEYEFIYISDEKGDSIKSHLVSGMWEAVMGRESERGSGREQKGDHPPPSFSSAVCTGKQMKATREANTLFYGDMGTKCCDPNFQKRRWLRALLIYQHCFVCWYQIRYFVKIPKFWLKNESKSEGKDLDRVKRQREPMSHDMTALVISFIYYVVLFFFEEHVHNFTRYIFIEVRASSEIFTWLDPHSGLFTLFLYELQILTSHITPPG